MSIASLVPLIREGLGVSSSYDAVSIPAYIKSAAKRLLRDYNFPKSLKRVAFNPMGVQLSQPSFNLPAGVGKIKAVRINDPVSGTWTDPLERRDGFVLPVLAGVGDIRWWQEGLTLRLSDPTSGDLGTYQLLVWYQTLDPDADGGWIYDDFEDVLRYMTIYREAAGLRKPEVQQAYSTLYTEELSALAIYLNEIEWSSVVVNQREARPNRSDRYPAQ